MLDLFRTLPGLMADIEGAEVVREALVFAAWRRTAGEALSSHTAPVKLVDSTLTVAVASLTWQRHLQDLGGQMLFKLNSTLGAPIVSYIQLDIDEAAVLRERGPRTVIEGEARKLAEQEITPEMATAAEQIEDEELRRQFLAAAGNCLVRRSRAGL
ncbi:MAG TPA: DUF721 domain-containing protein [Pyrinomonadaceae bacterium]|nr:DUF721 domain-containing protein [Pyrinomonadaceae bacterium]